VVFYSCKILQFLVIKNHPDPELDPDPQLPKMLDLETNTDPPQHCKIYKKFYPRFIKMLLYLPRYMEMF
jgi:hypothetical protein